MDLSALADFDLVATHGGFGKASRSSGRAKATLSRHIMELELSLGIRLIERGARTLRLTEEGAALYERTHGLLADLAEAGAAASSGLTTPRGTLRISAPVLFAHTLMGALAAEYTKAYPDVRLDIRAEDRKIDLVEDGYDIAIRVNPHPDSTLVGRCFARDRMLLVAPDGLRRPRRTAGGIPDIPAVVLSSAFDQGPWTFQEGKTTRTVNPDPPPPAALIPQSMVRPGPASEGLAIWGAVPDRQVELWALHRSRRLVNAKVSTFIDFLCARFPDRWL